MKEIFSNSQYTINFFIYLLVAFVAVAFAFLSKSLKIKIGIGVDGSKFLQKKSTFNKFFFFMSFITLAIFSFIIVTGADRESYFLIISELTFEKLKDPQVEFGYELICIFLRAIFKNPYLVIASISFITVALNFLVIFLFRKEIHVGFAVFMYVAMFYFQMLNLQRIYLAAALCLISCYFLFKNKKILTIIFVLLGFSIHYSAIFTIAPIIIYWFFKILKIKGYRENIAITVFFVLGMIFFLVLLPILIEKVEFLEKYEYVLENTESGFGFAQIIYFIPMLFVLLVYSHINLNKKVGNLAYIYLLLGFAVGIISYKIPLFGRLGILIEFAFVILIPHILQSLKENNIVAYQSNCKIQLKQNKFKVVGIISVPYYFISICVVIYSLVRMYYYFVGYFFLDKIQEMQFIWEILSK